jgi:HK97 family phage portal protein
VSVIGRAAAALRPRNDSPVPLSGTRSGASYLTAGRSTAGRTNQLKAMETNGTLFAIIDRLATSVGAAQWDLWRIPATPNPENPDEGYTPVTVHAALDLIRKPNPFFTWPELIESVIQHYDLVGEGVMVIGTDPRFPSLPLELWPVRPDRIAPVPDPYRFISGWVYTGPDGEQVPLRVDQVLRIRRPDPADPYGSISAVRAVSVDIASARDAALWNRNWFRNNAIPGGVVEFPEPISQDQFDEFVDRWQQSHKGVSNAARVGVLDAGAKFSQTAIAHKDMQFVELRHVSRDVLREAYTMPKFALGDVEDVNRASAEASDVWFAKQLEVPRLNRLRDMLNHQLLPRFGSTGVGVEFKFRNPVPEDQEQERAERDSKRALWESFVAHGAEPASAARELGLPEVTFPATTTPQDTDPAPAADEPGEPSAVEQAKARAEVVQKLYLGVDGNILLTADEGRALLADAGIDLDAAAWAAREAEQDTEPEPEPELGQDETEPGTTTDSPAPASGPGENPAGGTEPPSGPAATPLADATAPRPRAQIEGPDDIDLTRVQEDWERAVEVLLSQWGTITTAQYADLVDQVRAAVDRGDIAALSQLSTDSDEGAALLLAAMTTLGATAADQVVREAAEQGVEIEPVPPAEDDLSDTAVLAAAGLAAGLALAAGQEAGRVYTPGMTGQQVADLVAVHLDSLTDARPREVLGGAMTGAQNEARTRTFTEQPADGPIAALYASEVLDSNTCGPCRAIHGRFIATADGPETPDEVRKLYPQRGFVDCLGRDRCRGTIVGLWRSQTAGGDQ